MSGAEQQGDLLSRSELRKRASAGLAITASWGFLNLVLGFAGNVALARMLLPRDFGLVALGATMVLFANALSEGGLGGGLIRRSDPPARGELAAVLAIQLGLTSALALVIAAAAIPFGEAGAIVAVMVASLPVVALQTPGRVVLARTLLYERLAVVDLTALVTYYVWAIAGVVAGFGVWALATGAVVRALAATAVMVRVSRLGILRPSLSGSAAIRPLVAFGIRFQAVSLTTVARDQVLNVTTGALAGVATLGLWSLVSRLMQVPLLLFESLWRVSFPAMSQLLAAKEDPAPAIERGVALSSVAAGLLLAGLAGSSPELVPGVFGEQWREASAVVPWACLALLVGGPISVATVGYLYAAGRPSAVLGAAGGYALVWLAVALPLLPVVGVAALGIGWLAGSLADAALLARAAGRLSGARLVRPLLAPLAGAVAAGGAGLTLAASGPSNLLSALVGGAAAAAVYIALLLIVRKSLMLEVGAVVFRSVGAALSRASAGAGPPRRPPRPEPSASWNASASVQASRGRVKT